MISQLYLHPGSWSSSNFVASQNLSDFQILRWKDSNSITSRMDNCLSFLDSISSAQHIDLGCGLGHLIQNLTLANYQLIQGVEISDSIYELLLSRLPKSNNLKLYNSSIRDALPFLQSQLSIRPLSISMIGVLQNCEENPFTLLSDLLAQLSPDFIYITTKASWDLSVLKRFDPYTQLHTLFYLPELLDLFNRFGYLPVNISTPSNSPFSGFNYRFVFIPIQE